MFKNFIVLFVLLFSNYFIFAANEIKESENISITNVKIQEFRSEDIKEIAEIIINDTIKIKDIKIDKSGNIKYPVYISKSGKEYIQFEPVSKQAKNEIENALKTKKLSGFISKAINYKIIEFRPLKSKYRKINAKILFNNSVSVSCGIMEGKEGPWIAWPSVKNEKSGSYDKQVIFKNKDFKKTIEKNLISKYLSQKTFLNSEEE